MSSEESHNLIRIAQVLKSNGTDGETVIGTRGIAPCDINLTEPVFIYFDGLPVPFFIESLTQKGTAKAIVRLTDIGTFEDAEEFKGKGIFVSQNSLEDAQEDDFSILCGWTLFAAGEDSDEEIGVITDFLDIPENPCIEARTKKGAVTIPLHEDLIVSVDPDKREIVMDIPDGLLII